MNIDTDAVGRLGMLTARAKTQSVLCLVQKDRKKDKQHNNNIGRDVHLVKERLERFTDVRLQC